MALYGLKIKRPYIGNIYPAGGGRLYGYTGLQDFDDPAVGSQVLMRATLDSAANFQYWWTANYSVAFAAAEGVGYNITVDGTIVAKWSAGPVGGIPPGAGVQHGSLFAPANTELVFYLDNPDGGAGTAVAAGFYLQGQRIATSSAGVEVGTITVPPGLAAMQEAQAQRGNVGGATAAAGAMLQKGWL